MIWRLLLLLAAVSAVEVFLLLQLGAWLGAGPTFALLILTAVLGGWVAKREGLHAIQQVPADAARGIPPGPRMAEAALVVLAGVLLMAPGVLTDLVGLLLILPPVRRALAPRVAAAVAARLGVDPDGWPDAGPNPAAPDSSPRAPRNQNHPFASPFDDLP